MIITVISFILLVSGLIATAFLAISLLRKSPITAATATWLTKSELGQFEERLSELIEVILIADEIDVPSHDNTKEILAALIDNFSENVHYNFIVPESYAESNGDDILLRYYAIINLAGQLSQKDLSHSLFQLHKRPVEREHKDFPYLFFRYVSQEGRSEVVAFRGENLGKGIAEHYRRLEPEIARSFLFSALPYMASVDQPIKSEDYAKFTPDSKRLIFEPIRHQKEGDLISERTRSIPNTNN